MATHLSTRQTQFSYFNQLLGGPVWKGRKILDFGGNVGGFLAGSGNHVDHEDYWCLDLTQAAIDDGRRTYPQAHFVYYDRYSSYFNPNGVRKLTVPDLGLKFDIILAFSVFTHTHRNEMLELVEQLRSKLVPQGVLAFTFFDPVYDQSLSNAGLPSGASVLHTFDRQHAKRAPESGLFETARHPYWYLAVDDQLHAEPGIELCQQERAKPGESYCSYFTADYMKLLFPDATVHPPVSPEWQHCCILKKPK